MRLICLKLTEGKYLIYKDSATTALDSVIVTASKLTNLYFPKQVVNNITYQAHTVEQFSLVLTKYAGSATTEWFYGYAKALAIFAITNNNADMDLSEQSGNWAFVFKTSTPSIPSMVIEGKAYNEVIVTESKNGVDINHPAYKLTTYYWAKGVGIILRRTITTGGIVKTYFLLRNN